jgi:hypothetical protein
MEATTISPVGVVPLLEGLTPTHDTAAQTAETPAAAD